MLKKILTISFSILLLISLIYTYFYFSNFKNYKDNETIKAIPTDASLIIQAQNPQKVIHLILESIKYKHALTKFQWFNSFTDVINKIDSTENYKGNFLDNLKSRELTISLHRQGKENLRPIFLLPLKNKAEQKNIISFLKEQKENFIITKERKYNTSTIYTLKINSSNNLFVTFEKGIIIASQSNILLENSLRQLNTEFSLFSDETFKKLFKTVSYNCDANIFINFENIPETLRLLFNKEYKSKLEFFKRIANWGEFDVTLNENKILINGFLQPSKNNNNINTLFKGVNSSTTKINQIIPSNSDFVISYSFNGTKKLNKNLKQYLEKNNEIQAFNKKVKALNLVLKENNAEEIVFNIIDDEFAIVYANSNPLQKNEGKYLIIKTIGKTKTLNAIKTLNNGKKLEPIEYYKLDKQTSYPIYSNTNTNIFKIILDNYLPSVPIKYFTFLNNYLIFSDSKRSLSSIIYSNILKKTLHNNKYHQQFSENFSYKENLFIYCNLSKISDIIPNASTFSILNPNKDQKLILSNFYGLGIQLTNNNNLLYTNLCIEFLPGREKEPETIWQSKLDSTIITKPTLVENHLTKEKEIFVQDKSNTIYLISYKGRILWKKKLDAPILSEVFQIDYYQNNKLQYLFNTENRIYLIDRNGNPVDKYPINLSYKASNGLALFDYDKNKKYRIFIACKNQATYVFDKHGKTIKGWNAMQTEGIITNPIQHFRIQNKDYIVFSDEKRNYILNRKGENRVNIETDFIRNKYSIFYESSYNNTPSILTTDINGNVRTINLNTGECKTQKVINSPEPHYFAAKKFKQNEDPKWVIITKTKVILKNKNGKTLFNNKIEGNIMPKADIYQFSFSNKKIGVFDTNNNKIYLINDDGSYYKDFPLKGQSRFSIGFLNSTSNNFNLIVGGEDNYLYNYRIE